MKKTIFNGKSIAKALGIIALPMAFALTSCTEDQVIEPEVPSTPDAEQTEPVQQMNTATYTVGSGDQSRVFNSGYWYPVASRATAEWAQGLSFDKPANAVDVTAQNYDQNASVYYIPEGFEGHVYNVNFNAGTTLYNYGKVILDNNVNGSGILTVYNAGELTWSVSTGERHTVYNAGNLTVNNYANIGDIYNVGDLILNVIHSTIYPEWNGWQPVEVDVADIPDAMSIYSQGGTVTIPGEGDLKATCYIDDVLYVEGYLNIQNDKPQVFCGIKSVNNDNINIDSDITTSFIEAKDIVLNGNSIFLKKEGYIKANKVSFEGNGKTGDGSEYEAIKAEAGSYALVDANEFFCKNDKLSNHLGAGVYANFNTITYKDGGIEKTASASDYEDVLAQADGINNGTISGTSECGGEWGSKPETPVEPENPGNPDPDKPSLDQVAEVESQTHDHDADKSDPNRRHLSATSLTFDGAGNIYASYHMRGGNWGGDTYDKDDIEGCIERWTFNPETGIEIGNWMWTDEFDFNHIILDGSYVVTVGHKGGEKTVEGDNGQKYTDFGGIIGRFPTNFYDSNWDNTDELKLENFTYKYLTTEVPIYVDSKDQKNEDGTPKKILSDYKNAGDGNCVVRVGDKYYVATSAGYGVIDSEFKRVKDDEGKVLFTSTPGSAKYLVENNGTVNVLYLNDRPQGASTATTSFGATMAVMNNFPFNAETWALPANVTPVDGKNVIATDGSDIYSCLSKGGLAKNGQLFKTFGESRSVNGVAVDDRFIYVANGNYISVLDKAGNVIVERKGNTENVSANFVEVQTIGGEIYVFVAFGQEGIKVYHLNNV